MKPFSLENVLHHRKRLEDLAQGKYIEAKEVVTTIRQRYEAEQEKLKSLLLEIERIQRDGIEITMLIRYQEHAAQIEEHLAAIEKNLKEKERLAQQIHKNLLDRTKDRQIMEQLKEKQNRAWQRHLNKKEAMMLDEIAVMRHGKEL